MFIAPNLDVGKFPFIQFMGTMSRSTNMGVIQDHHAEGTWLKPPTKWVYKVWQWQSNFSTTNIEKIMLHQIYQI